MKTLIVLTTLVMLLLQPVAGMAARDTATYENITALEPGTGCYRILFDETHGTTSDISVGEYTITDAYEQLADHLRSQGHIVDALQDPALLDMATLELYDVLVLALPTEYYTATEKGDIANYVSQGGRLITIAENGGYPGDYREILNDLHASLGDGMQHNQDIIEDATDNQGGDSQTPLIHIFSSDPVNAGVETVLEMYASSLQVLPPAVGTAFGDNDTTIVLPVMAGTSADNAQTPESIQANGPVVIQALAVLGAGDVFAIGDANLWDNSDPDSDGVINLFEFDNAQLARNVFAFGKQCSKCRWALFKDRQPWPQSALLGLSAPYQVYSSGEPVNTHLQPDLVRGDTLQSIQSDADPVWLDPNERILREWEIPYKVFRSSDIPGVDLELYCKTIIASDQPSAFYKNISDNRAWFEAWIDAGGLLEFHGAPILADNWGGLPMPGGFSMAYYTTNNLSIINPQHLLFKRPHMIKQSDIVDWGFSAHGYLTNLPPSSYPLINHDDQGEPAAAKFELGEGCVLATLQTLEWGWDRNGSPMLENFLRYDDCSGNYQLYLSLTLNNAP